MDRGESRRLMRIKKTTQKYMDAIMRGRVSYTTEKQCEMCSVSCMRIESELPLSPPFILCLPRVQQLSQLGAQFRDRDIRRGRLGGLGVRAVSQTLGVGADRRFDASTVHVCYQLRKREEEDLGLGERGVELDGHAQLVAILRARSSAASSKKTTRSMLCFSYLQDLVKLARCRDAR